MGYLADTIETVTAVRKIAVMPREKRDALTDDAHEMIEKSVSDWSDQRLIQAYGKYFDKKGRMVDGLSAEERRRAKQVLKEFRRRGIKA